MSSDDTAEVIDNTPQSKADKLKHLNRNARRIDTSEILGSPYMDRGAAKAALKAMLAVCQDRVVVLSGCGGGCDVYGAVYLLNQVKKVAKKVVLANLGFTSVDQLRQHGKCVLGPNKCFAVPPGVSTDECFYFPEALLANAVKQPVYCFKGGAMSVEEIANSHKAILAAEGVTNPATEAVLFLVDGGCDAILTGTETGLATPVEDMLHLRGTQQVGYMKCFLSCIGLDVDCGHGVVFGEMVQRLDKLKKSGGILFADILTMEDENAAFFHDIVSKCDPINTIVQSLACAAIEGWRGDYTPEHLVPRIGKSRVPLTDFTASFFIFDHSIVAKEVVYLPALQPHFRAGEMMQALSAFRKSIGRRD